MEREKEDSKRVAVAGGGPRSVLPNNIPQGKNEIALPILGFGQEGGEEENGVANPLIAVYKMERKKEARRVRAARNEKEGKSRGFSRFLPPDKFIRWEGGRRKEPPTSVAGKGEKKARHRAKIYPVKGEKEKTGLPAVEARGSRGGGKKALIFCCSSRSCANCYGEKRRVTIRRVEAAGKIGRRASCFLLQRGREGRKHARRHAAAGGQKKEKGEVKTIRCRSIFRQ